MTTQPALALAHAERLLDSSGVATPHSARLAAVLARQALEELVSTRCAELGVAVHDATMRSKLVILRSLDTQERADAAALAWNRLSSVCHHHAFELSPTVAEVRHLCAAVATLLKGP
ncbi:hypothetical protein [Rhodococcoides kroppenstedtii]|uniref:hypothetical protein n=1 Tax=Rhodococcoides kroppenstedtii TaxID=293050 RepID=UPI0027E09C11|nr:hypothetical protein [Rhodococcus kroppenstedtii]